MIEEGEQRAKELNVMFIETSAKTGCNVKQVIPAFSPYFIYQLLTAFVRDQISSIFKTVCTSNPNGNMAAVANKGKRRLKAEHRKRRKTVLGCGPQYLIMKPST